jgi:hypothetical protein
MSKKQIIILASAGAAVLLLLAGVFVVIPAIQVGAYKETVGAKQSQLNESLNRLSSVLERDMFVKTNVEPATVRSDVRVGNDAVRDAENTIAAVKKDLTSFAALPVFGYSEDYRTATTLRTDEQAYIQKSEAFIAEMKAVLAYIDKSNDLMTEFSKFSEAAAQADMAESAEEYVAIVDDSTKKLQPTLDELKKMNPPASLKEQHDYGVKTFDEVIDLYKDSATAVRLGDAEKYAVIGERMIELSNEMTTKFDDLNADFVRESPLRKLDDALRAIDAEISRKQASM